LSDCGLDGGSEFGGGVAGDRDPDVQLAGEVVVPQFEVEGVVDLPPDGSKLSSSRTRLSWRC
jgi:hypothetical protein